MVLESLPEFVRTHYEVYEWKHAIAILKNDFPNEYRDIIDVLTKFRLRQSDIQKPGGRKSDIAESIDGWFEERGWKEKGFLQTSHLLIQQYLTCVLQVFEYHSAVIGIWSIHQ